MSFDVIKTGEGTSSGPPYQATERLWLDADGKVVPDGHPDAAELLAAGPGDEIPMPQAVALGLATGGHGSPPETSEAAGGGQEPTEPVEEDQEKGHVPTEDKKAVEAKNKRVKMPGSKSKRKK